MTEQEITQARDDLEQLSIEQLRCGVMLQLLNIEALTKECDALAADAERYRWMTLHIVSGDMEALEEAFMTIGEDKESITQAEFDAVIDAAIKEAGVQ